MMTVLAVLAAATGEVRDADVDRIVAGNVRADGPGVAVGVFRDGEVVHMAGRGLADVERGEPITPQSAFDLASVSKQFTALAVMILAERGAVDLGRDIREYLPELPEFVEGDPVTVEHLLHMTSGLPDYLGFLDSLEGVEEADVLRELAGRPLEFDPGERYEYSNTNFVLLGEIVRRAAGKSLRQFLEEEVFGPAGMDHAELLEAPGQEIEGRVRGYARAEGGWEVREDDTSVVGDGQVFVTLEDMAAWDRALRERRFASREMWERAWTSGRLDSGEETGYGFGWSVSEGEGHPFVAHGGGWAGTSTYFVRFLEDGLSIVALSNDEDLDVDEIAEEIARHYLRD